MWLCMFTFSNNICRFVILKLFREFWKNERDLKILQVFNWGVSCIYTCKTCFFRKWQTIKGVYFFFLQVSLQHLFQVCTLTFSLILEVAIEHGCIYTRTMRWSYTSMITSQLTQLIMEKMRHSCSCSRVIQCMCLKAGTYVYKASTVTTFSGFLVKQNS